MRCHEGMASHILDLSTWSIDDGGMEWMPRGIPLITEPNGIVGTMVVFRAITQRSVGNLRA